MKMSSCNEKILLVGIITSILLVLGVDVYFAYYASDNFHKGYDQPPDEPNTTVVNTTTTTTTSYYYYETTVAPEVKEYLNEWSHYSRYFNKAQIYVIIPCGVSAFFMFSLLLYSRNALEVFKSTTPLFYTAFSTILALVAFMGYMNSDETYYKGPNYMNLGLESKNVTIMGSIMLFGNFYMFIISICLLTKKSWNLPSLSKIVTLDKIMEITKLILNILVLFHVFSFGLFINGMKESTCSYYDDEFSCRYIPFPYVYGYTLLCSLCCGLISSSASILSGVIGTAHKGLETLLAFFMTVCLGFSVVVTSAIFIHSVLRMGIFWGFEFFWLCIGFLFGFNLLHFIMKLAAPNFIHKSPASICYIDNILSLPTNVPIQTMSPESMMKLKMLSSFFKNKCMINVTLFVASFTGMCLGASYHDCDFWSAFCISANAVTVVSSLTNLIQYKSKVEANDTIKNFSQTCIEIVILIIGGISILINGWSVGKLAGLFSLLCASLNIYRLNSEFPSRKIHFTSMLSKFSEEPLLNDEETANNDEEQPSDNISTTTTVATEEDDSLVVKIENLHDVPQQV